MTPLHFVAQLVPVSAGSPSGGLNCQLACAAMLVAHATGGKHKPSAEQVRALARNENGTPDRVGGTTLRQAADAIHRGWGVDVDVRMPMQFAEMRDHLRRNPDVIGSVSHEYAAFRGTRAYASRNGFGGNHQAVVRWAGEPGAEFSLWDPLADGRAGVPKAPVPISADLLRRAAGALRLNSSPVRRLGVGLAYVGFARAPKAIEGPVRYSARFTTAAFWVYVDGTRSSRRFLRATSAPCGPPVMAMFNGQPKRVVRVTAGVLKGRFVEPARDGVTLVEVR